MTVSELLQDVRDILITQTRNVQAERRPLAAAAVRCSRSARALIGL